jgi:hypothetical protein
VRSVGTYERDVFGEPDVSAELSGGPPLVGCFPFVYLRAGVRVSGFGFKVLGLGFELWFSFKNTRPQHHSAR